MSESTNLKTWSLEAQPSIASVGRKVLSSYGWCSHFVGEPIAYAIVKEQWGVNPSSELEQVSWKHPTGCLLSTPALGHRTDRTSWAERNDTGPSTGCQVILSRSADLPRSTLVGGPLTAPTILS